MRIKVVFLIGQLGLGGSERQLSLLLQHFDQSSFELSVIVFNPSPYYELTGKLNEVGVQVFALPDSVNGVVQRIRYLYGLFRDLSPDIVHSWTVHDNPYAGLVGWMADIPVRWGSVRGSLNSLGFINLPAIYRWLSLHSVSHLTINARSIEAELHKLGYPSERAFLLPNCVRLCVPSEALELSSLGILENHQIVGAVGNLRRNKNHTMLIESLAKVIPEYPDVRGLIVGQPIPDEADLLDSLNARIQQCGLKGRVSLIGFRNDVADLMARFSIFCLTSNSEGTPNVVLEAMAASRPVIATRVGGVPDLVRDGVNGFLVERGDVDGLIRAIKTLLDNPQLAEKMGHAGREIVEHEYGCDQAVDRLTNAYQRALMEGIDRPKND